MPLKSSYLGNFQCRSRENNTTWNAAVQAEREAREAAIAKEKSEREAQFRLLKENIDAIKRQLGISVPVYQPVAEPPRLLVPPAIKNWLIGQ